MLKPAIPPDEKTRIDTLKAYKIYMIKKVIL